MRLFASRSYDRDRQVPGWQVVFLDNGVIRAGVVPQADGRVLQFWSGDHAYLFVKPVRPDVVGVPDSTRALELVFVDSTGDASPMATSFLMGRVNPSQ